MGKLVKDAGNVTYYVRRTRVTEDADPAPPSGFLVRDQALAGELAPGLGERQV